MKNGPVRAALCGALLMCAASLGGCGVVTAQLPPVTAPLSHTTVDERSMIAAEGTYNVVIHAYNVARPHLDPATVARAKPLVQKAHDLRKAAEAAYGAGNASDLDTQLQALGKVLDGIKKLVPS